MDIIEWASKIPVHDLSDGKGLCRVIFAEDFLNALKELQSAQPEERTEKRTETHACDLVSRQAAIDALYDWSEHSMTDAEAWHIRQVIGDIKSMPSAQPKQRWIPVTERLPEENRYVLICTKHQAITDGRHERGTWWIAWEDRCYEDEENLILAWMPLPAPYKEEGKNAPD